MNKVKKSALSLGLVGGGLAAFAASGLRSETLSDLIFPSTQRHYVPIREDEKMHSIRPHAAPHIPAQNGSARFGDPLPGLTPDQLGAFGAGQEEFTNQEDIEGGLGPIFNDSSCVACHFTGATGGASNITVTRFGREINDVYDAMESLGGSLLQKKAIAPEVREVVPREATIIARRQTTPLFGLGLMEAIPDDAILRNAAEQARGANTSTARVLSPMGGPRPPQNPPPGGAQRPPDGNPPMNPPTMPPNDTSIHGRAAMVTDVVSGARRVGRFGWKAQQATVLAFSGDAYLNEMGITNRFFPHENAPNGDAARLAAFDVVKDIEDEADPSTGKADIDASADYMRFLAAPPQLPLTPSANEGRRIFKDIQCATCHTPMMMTGPNPIRALDRKEVWLFSDLLLHDMGTLGDGIMQSAAGAKEFRTAPLWGLRASGPYLHDGRARTIEQAILLHDGEAKNSRDRYQQLTPQQRQQILEFLGKI